MKKLLLTMLGMLMALPTFARDFDYTYEGQTLTYTVISEDDKTVKTKGGNNNPGNYVSGTLIIPATVKDGDTEYIVTEIGDEAFDSCEVLTSVTIPESVTSIGERAFAFCSGLTKAEFASIESLCSINFVHTSSNPLYYAHHLYIEGKEITNLVIPETVTSIGNYAFVGCSRLTSVNIPNSVQKIGDGAFYNCWRLTDVIYNAENCTSGGSISYPTFPSSIRNLTIGNNVKTIPNYTFYCCSDLTSVTIPNSVQKIGNYAFAGCRGLTEVTIPNSVLTIGIAAFRSCSGLASVTIGNSVRTIGDNAFYYCSGLTEVIYNAENCTSCGSKSYPAFPSSIRNLTIGNNVKTIPDCAFYDCSGMTEMTIPNSVQKIGGEAFSYCTGLTSVTIPNSVTSIGESAFESYIGLTEVTIPNSVTSIGSDAFFNCSGLTKAEFASIESLCSINFVNNTSNPLYYARHLYIEGKEITDLVIPETVTSIGNYAFAGCSGLTEIVLPAELATLGEYVWGNCPAIKSVVYTGATPIEANQNIFDTAIYDEATLYVPKGQKQAFMKVNPWSYFYHIDDEGVNGVEDVTVEMEDSIDFDKEYEVYNLSGAWVGGSLESLSHGFYIVRQGNMAKKVAIK